MIIADNLLKSYSWKHNWWYQKKNDFNLWELFIFENQMLDEKKKEKKDISYIMRIASIVKKYIILSFNVSDKIKDLRELFRIIE